MDGEGAAGTRFSPRPGAVEEFRLRVILSEAKDLFLRAVPDKKEILRFAQDDNNGHHEFFDAPSAGSDLISPRPRGELEGGSHRRR